MPDVPVGTHGHSHEQRAGHDVTVARAVRGAAENLASRARSRAWRTFFRGSRFFIAVFVLILVLIAVLVILIFIVVDIVLVARCGGLRGGLHLQELDDMAEQRTCRT